ncbi:kynureninase [Truepera radiovictrix]|uniref:Kynureninase n=1 Tax=Truepera radiovictrix (strain DSM 17093 / CIP 108686 / LMG 22925 / RQ-24) TaxID=649638 RepID=D7CT11_TRURR|nr:kynureninase [Truepera radiovictrix]ADI15474.1 kynureninase [Truepera radiovictrix DSM 17093]WMT55975.1 kynureninase [Truepera radiovictrix]
MKRDAFLLPRGIYLDGNSLGPLCYGAQAAIERRLKGWQHLAVSAWEEWFGLAERLSPALAKLVGARPDEVIATGSITSNLHALLATFYRPEGARRNLLATALDFPSDLYALAAWAERGGGELKLVPSRDGHTLHEEDLLAALTPDVAVAVLPTVLYRSGQLLDVAALTRAAHEAGVLIGWDAAHSIGAVPHDFHDDGVDFAVWCSYKYLNAGPGAPGGLFVHERHFERAPGLPGWWGSDKAVQFEMAPTFRKARGAGAFQMGTPSILALAGLEGALGVFEEVTIADVRQRSLALTDYLIALADTHLPECSVKTPRDPRARGAHVALEHPEAHLLSLALRARHIIPDYRAPNLLRLAPVALYNTEAELEQTVAALQELLRSGAHRAFRAAGGVT